MARLFKKVIVVLSPKQMSAPDGCDGYVCNCPGQVFAPPGVDLCLQQPRAFAHNEAVVGMNVGDHFAAVPLMQDLKLQMLPHPYVQHRDLLARGQEASRVELVDVVPRHMHWSNPDVTAALAGA
jgi:hypothetical protein